MLIPFLVTARLRCDPAPVLLQILISWIEDYFLGFEGLFCGSHLALLADSELRVRRSILIAGSPITLAEQGYGAFPVLPPMPPARQLKPDRIYSRERATRGFKGRAPEPAEDHGTELIRTVTGRL
jgi:hypothetical protein